MPTQSSTIVITGFVKTCVGCRCEYLDTESPIPPMHESDIDPITRGTMDVEGYLRRVKHETTYGYCHECDYLFHPGARMNTGRR